MRRAVWTCVVLVLLAGAFGLGVLAFDRDVQSQLSTAPATRPAPQLRAVPKAEELRREVARVLAGSYYRPVDSSVLGKASVGAMIAALGDPYTEYLSPAEYASLRNRTARTYSGVGLTVGQAGEGLIVTSALDGPAREAGIRRGDIIVRIDGRPARRLTYDQSLTLIKGEVGTLVHLTVKRPDTGVIHFTVVRQRIPAPSLRSRIIRVAGTRIGYVRLLAFPGNAADRLDAAAERLVSRGAQGLILDLRGNPGGLLGQAVRSVSLFLADGVVCTVEGRHQARRVYGVSGTASLPLLPLVVLVDRGSASAAEIVAAALADHRRATVVGERTYGKTQVQSVTLLSNGAALKLTTATYLTPLGTDLVGRGLVPKVVAVDDPLTPPDEAVVAGEKSLFAELEQAALTSPR
jgi:carboxyl-terminal processing protease